MMPTMILSGMIFPIESMPLVLQVISDVLPARWYIQAVRKLMIEGVDVSICSERDYYSGIYGDSTDYD